MNVRTIVFAGLVALALFGRTGSAGAQDAIPQLPLSDALISRFVAALPEMNAAAAASPETSNASDAKLRTATEAIAKKHGFESYQQFSEVSSSIALVLVGIDPATKSFTEPKVTIEQQIKVLTQTLADLKESLQAAQRTTDPRNVELVIKHHSQISTAAMSK